MLDLPDQPLLDKHSIIGSCVRLALMIDADRLAREVGALPEASWGTTGGRVGVHRKAEAIFLRGYAPAEGDKPIHDREPLAALPYARFIIEQLIPASPMRCLLARLPPDAVIAPHIDTAPYFAKTLRLHFPIESHDRAWMISGELAYLMTPGEVWALNNSAPHAVWNAHPTRSRTHMICDFLAAPALVDLIQSGERGLGRRMPDVSAHVSQPHG